jgi:hypothetical protein
MAISKYRKFGLRRDNNFSDLSNSTEALNNLLDTLVDESSSTFISEDLNAIRNTFSLGLTNEEYRQIIGSETKITDQDGTVRPFIPRITFKNKLDQFEVFSGQPISSGGNGLTAKYYSKVDVFENTTQVFSGTPIRIDNFWESGNFDYSERINSEYVNVTGGVEWEGYFIPTETGQYTFSINSSAGFTFDFETEGYVSGIGTYTEISRIGISSTFSGSGSINTNTITLTNSSNIKYVAIGQSVSGVGIETGSTVSSYNINGVVSLSPPTGISTAINANVNGNINFTKEIGQDTRISHRTYILNEFQKYRIRFRYFIPQSIDAIDAQKYIQFYITTPTTLNSESLRYTDLYSLDYNFSQSSVFQDFIESSILFGGGSIGSQTNADNYVKLKTSSKVNVSYIPKSSVSNIIKSTISGSIVSGTNIMTMLNTQNLEVGNYVFGTGIPEGTRIEKIYIDRSITLSQVSTSSTTSNYTFIDHRGFVKRVFGGSSGSTFSLSSGNTTDLRTGMIMIGSGVQSYTRITTNGTTNSFSISPAQTITAGTAVYFYQSKGLINDSLKLFCVPTETRCLIATATASAGSTTIQVQNTTGISVNSKLQGFQFNANTVIQNFDSTSITLNQATIANINAGANFTVTTSSGDRSICCPPTDTSPPFNPTEIGLETVSDAKNLRIESGNILFDSLSATLNNSKITNYSISDTSNSRISIQTPLTTVGTAQTTIFKILCS